MSANDDRLENFIRAFGSGCGGCRRECECGRKFYSNERGYDWEPGEYEALHADPKARCVDYTVSTIYLEGKEFCVDCDCWHKRAGKIMEWIDRHGREVAEWLTLEKKRKQAVADRSPVVKETP